MDFSPVEILRRGGQGRVMLTCEHASRALPPWLHADAAEEVWLDSHWGWDIGAAALTRQLSVALEAPAVLAGFSRLVCDPNRSPGNSTWIRSQVEGHPLSFNQGLDDAERLRRCHALYLPYHQAVDTLLVDRLVHRLPTFLFSVHSFTPNYMGQRRDMEMGVLYDLHEALAEGLAEGLRGRGYQTALNAPWSGREGLAYSPDRHGRAHAVPYLELEVRQDLIGDGAGVTAVAQALAPLVREIAASC